MRCATAHLDSGLMDRPRPCMDGRCGVLVTLNFPAAADFRFFGVAVGQEADMKPDARPDISTPALEGLSAQALTRLPAPAMITNDAGNILWVNQALCALSGYAVRSCSVIPRRYSHPAMTTPRSTNSRGTPSGRAAYRAARWLTDARADRSIQPRKPWPALRDRQDAAPHFAAVRHSGGKERHPRIAKCDASANTCRLTTAHRNPPRPAPADSDAPRNILQATRPARCASERSACQWVTDPTVHAGQVIPSRSLDQ